MTPKTRPTSGSTHTNRKKNALLSVLGLFWLYMTEAIKIDKLEKGIWGTVVTLIKA